MRVNVDVREERIARKVADAYARAIPLFVTVGAREAAEGTVSLRNADGTYQVRISSRTTSNNWSDSDSAAFAFWRSG